MRPRVSASPFTGLPGPPPRKSWLRDARGSYLTRVPLVPVSQVMGANDADDRAEPAVQTLAVALAGTRRRARRARDAAHRTPPGRHSTRNVEVDKSSREPGGALRRLRAPTPCYLRVRRGRGTHVAYPGRAIVLRASARVERGGHGPPARQACARCGV